MVGPGADEVVAGFGVEEDGDAGGGGPEAGGRWRHPGGGSGGPSEKLPPGGGAGCPSDARGEVDASPGVTTGRSKIAGSITGRGSTGSGGGMGRTGFGAAGPKPQSGPSASLDPQVPTGVETSPTGGVIGAVGGTATSRCGGVTTGGVRGPTTSRCAVAGRCGGRMKPRNASTPRSILS